MISWHSCAKRFYFLFSCLLSLHQHMRRVSASLWRCHTTSFHLVWASRLLIASTRGPTPLIPSALTAPFNLCDTDRVLWMHTKDFGSITTGGRTRLKGVSDWSWLDLSHKPIHTALIDLQSRDRTANDGATKEDLHTTQGRTPWAGHIWMLEGRFQRKHIGCKH